MKVTLHIPIFGRAEIADRVVAGINTLYTEGKKKGIDLKVMYIFSNVQDYENYTRNLEPLDYAVYVENRPLGRKFNAGVQFLYKFNLQFDYFMQLGSDDILRHDYWDYAYPAMEAGYDIIGCKNLIVEDFDTGEEKHHKSSDIFGAGRLIREEILCKASHVFDCIGSRNDSGGMRVGKTLTVARHQFKPNLHKEAKPAIKIWDDDREMALDYNSECNIINRCGMVRITSIDGDQFLVRDIKTANNIHTFDKF